MRDAADDAGGPHGAPRLHADLARRGADAFERGPRRPPPGGECLGSRRGREGGIGRLARQQRRAPVRDGANDDRDAV